MPAITQSEPDLKPCPFCGGKPKFIRGYWFEQQWYGEEVICTQCHVSMAMTGNDKSVINKWNTRVISDPDSKLLTILVDYI